MNLRHTLKIAAGLTVLGLVVAGAALAAGGPPPWAGQGQQQAAAPLSSTERNALVYMREEEKLARDVYAKLAKSYPSNAIFSRIAQAEQTHMNAIGRLLTRYQIADPAAGKATGQFTNSELQRLYDALVARDTGTLAAALQVGVTIEKTDIADLQRYLGKVDNPDVKRVFTNLLRGSQSHLTAFSSGSLQNCACGQGAGQGNGPRNGNGNGPRRP
jgi:hypothetical protein